MKITKRVFISFDENCPYQCKHCYTYGIRREKIRTMEEIVDSISNEEFDVIYVSQKNDNFSEPMKGLRLCRTLFERYMSNLFIITRNVFNDFEVNELETLRTEMSMVNKRIFVAISLNSMESIGVCENVETVCTPEERIEFIKKLAGKGFMPILMLRPVFPKHVIPVDECLRVIEITHQYISCVVSSGLGINNDILNRLGMKESDFSYDENQDYLQGAIDCEIKFVNVKDEISKIRNKCQILEVPMFEHSMLALNYISDRENYQKYQK